MKYMLLMYANQDAMPNYSPEEQQAAFQEWQTLGSEMTNAGVLISSNGLLPAATNATNVRVRGGKTVIADGPFAETHEQLGGYDLVECKDLAEALGWAAKMPSAKWGTIEVRPLWGQQ